MANQIDWDKKYQEDLERAQALSLESLALEQFRQNKLLQEKSKIISKTPKNVPVNRAASMSETDSDRQPSKSRPRPGSSLSNQNNSLLAPPPSSQRKSSSASSCDMPDLISFSSPPSKSSNLLDICSLQQYNHNISTPGSMSQTTYSPAPVANINTITSLNNPQRSLFYQSYQGYISGQQNNTPHTLRQPPYYSGNSSNFFLQSDKIVGGNHVQPSNVLSITPFPQQNRYQQNVLTPTLNIPSGSPFQSPSQSSQVFPHVMSDEAKEVTDSVREKSRIQ